MRHTPSGVPVVEFSLGHVSEQIEAEVKRRVECEVPCVALGFQAGLLQAATLGTQIAVAGFLSARSARNRTTVLHVKEIEFLEGNENGIQT
ncbi:MAG: primosomal replication protein N [Gammaproteobacteria bacterium]|nr:primosomal replication protein N [Gammaproteobacteria bacterium]MBU1415547.1 primosomal replication protein N [Gammaproteobacteria bacterium]